MSAGAQTNSGTIDLTESAADVAPVGVSRLARKGGLLLLSTDGSPFSQVGGSSLPQALVLADAATNTTPDGVIERHTSSGTTATGFGLTDAWELQSAGGNVRRVSTDVIDLKVATDAAEEGRRTFNLMAGGALAPWGQFTWVGGSANNPEFLLGNPASAIGILRATNNLQLVIGSAVIDMTSSSIALNAATTCNNKVLSTDSMKQGAALTNADLSKDVAAGTEFTLPAATLSATHTLTLAVTGAPITNQIIRVTRLDVTANTYVVKDDAATTLITFPVSLKGAADFKFNGTHFVLDRYWVLN